MWLPQRKDFVDENDRHVLTGELRIITNSKLWKLLSKGPNFLEAMSINLSKCKREIDIGLDLSIEQIISTNPKVTIEEFVKWKKRFSKLTTKSLI